MTNDCEHAPCQLWMWKFGNVQEELNLIVGFRSAHIASKGIVTEWVIADVQREKNVVLENYAAELALVLGRSIDGFVVDRRCHSVYWRSDSRDWKVARQWLGIVEFFIRLLDFLLQFERHALTLSSAASLRNQRLFNRRVLNEIRVRFFCMYAAFVFVIVLHFILLCLLLCGKHLKIQIEVGKKRHFVL